MRFHSGNLTTNPPPDYLDDGRHGGTKLANLGYCFFEGSSRFSGLEIQDAPFAVAQTLFKIELLITQLNDVSSGYFFAKTLADGSPYFALRYDSSAANIVFEYGTADGTRSEVFDASGLIPAIDREEIKNLEVTPHSIVLDVRGTTVALSINKETTVRQLGQLVPDCEPSANCLMNVGQASADGAGSWTGGACFRSATVQIPASSDLLDPRNHGQRSDQRLPGCNNRTGEVISEYCFDGTGGILVDANPPPLIKTAFTLNISARVNPGGHGYIATRSTSSDKRAFALFLDESGRFRLYYHVAKTAKRNNKVIWSERRFPRDSEMHQIVVTVSGVKATLVVDNEIYGVETLFNEITDCDTKNGDCQMYIGSRAPTSVSAGGRASTGYALTDGCIREARVQNAEPLGRTNRERFDLLRLDVHEQTARPTDGEYCAPLTGGGATGGLLVEGAPALISESEGMLLELTVDLSGASSKQTGYLFARSDDTGSRYFSLFASAVNSVTGARELQLWYRVVGSVAMEKRTLSKAFPASGATFRLAISDVTRRGLKVSRVTLAIAGVGPQTPKNLIGIVDDCGPASSTCATHLLQRQPTPGLASSGTRPAEGYVFSGACVSAAVLSP